MDETRALEAAKRAIEAHTRGDKAKAHYWTCKVAQHNSLTLKQRIKNYLEHVASAGVPSADQK